MLTCLTQLDCCHVWGSFVKGCKDKADGSCFTVSSIAGDLITGLGERQVSSAVDLAAALDSCSIGDDVKLKIRREASSNNPGKLLTLDLTLQDEVN